MTRCWVLVGLLLASACGDVTANINGLTVDAEGYLVIAYGGWNVIRVVDPATGATVREVSRGVRVPDDVETDLRSSGHEVWWTSLLSGEIGVSDGTGAATVLADLGTGANSIAFAPDGRLIVGRCGLGFGEDLFAIDAHVPSTPVTVFRHVGEGCSLNGMMFGADGWLYGAQPPQGRLVRVKLDGVTREVLAEGLSSEAYALTLDRDGTVYALDGKRVIRLVNGAVEVFVTLPVRGDNLVFSADGAELFVSTGPDARVLAFDRAGTMRVVVSGPPR